MAATVVVAAAVFGLAGTAAGLDDRPPRLLHADGLFGTRVANDATADLLVDVAADKPGARVFTEEGAAMRMAATAPVYVTHVRKLAFSSAKRLHDYRITVADGASDEQRLAYLREHEIDLVLLPLPDSIRLDMVRLLGSDPGWETIQRGDDLVGWRRRAGLTVRQVAAVEQPARPALRDRVYRTRDGVRLAVDVDYPAELPAGGAPAVVLLHGGGWWSGNKGQLSEPGGLAHELAVAGFVAVSADYGLACSTPAERRALWGDEFDTENHACGARMRDQVADVQALVRWLHDNAAQVGIDRDRVALLGISAGGQLALRAAFDAAPDAPVAAVATWSGPPSTRYIAQQPKRPVPPVKSLRAPFANAAGCDFVDCPDAWDDASPLLHLDERDAPVAVLNIGGEAEQQVPFAEFERLHARLEQLGFEHQLLAGIEDCHGTSCGMRRLAGSSEPGIDATIAFLRRHLGVPIAGSAER